MATDGDAVEDGLTPFERMRRKNLATNNALLRSIAATSKNVIPAKKPPKPAPKKSSRTKREPVKREAAVPTRQSSRLAGLGADTDDTKRKAEDSLEIGTNDRAVPQQKKLRLTGDLSLGDIAVEGRRWEGSSLKDLGLGLSVRGAQPGVRTFVADDDSAATSKDVKDLRERLGSLNLYDKWAVNGKSFIYSLTVCLLTP
jgi:hypothetical protein